MKKSVVLILVMILLFMSFGMTAYSAPATDELQSTGYSIKKGGSNYTGAINKDDQITVTLSLFDDRTFPASIDGTNPPEPNVRLNTSSFTIDAQDNIQVVLITPSGSGWAYTLSFIGLTYTGTGNTMRVEIFYDNAEEMPLASYDLVINQCVESMDSGSDNTGGGGGGGYGKSTGFVLKSADYGQEELYAGQAFELHLCWLATNGSHRLENVTAGVTPTNEISLKDGVNLIYIGTVKPGKTVEVSFNLLPRANIDEGSYTVSVEIRGVDATTGSEVSAQAMVSVSILQPERFEIFKSELPTDLYAGMDNGMGYGWVTLVNKGRGTVTNVTVEMTGQGLRCEDGIQYLGNIAGGEQKTADLYILADDPGYIDAKLVISYENSRGEEKQLIHPFNISVQEFMMEDITDDDVVISPDDTASGTSLSWIWILLCAAAVAGGIVTVAVTRRNKKKKEAETEELDEYDIQNLIGYVQPETMSEPDPEETSSCEGGESL